jgi:hypothetical protein
MFPKAAEWVLAVSSQRSLFLFMVAREEEKCCYEARCLNWPYIDSREGMAVAPSYHHTLSKPKSTYRLPRYLNREFTRQIHYRIVLHAYFEFMCEILRCSSSFICRFWYYPYSDASC